MKTLLTLAMETMLELVMGVLDMEVEKVADEVADMEVDMVADMEVDMVAKILELHTNVRNAMQYHVIPYNTGQFYEANLWTLFFLM